MVRPRHGLVGIRGDGRRDGAVLGLDPAVGPGLQLFVPIIPLLVIAVVVWKWKLFPVRPVAGWYRRLTLFVFSGVVLGLSLIHISEPTRPAA